MNLRAWIRAADKGRRLQQKQLELIIRNISLPIEPGRDLYGSVFAVWTQAMIAMEGLIEGKPYKIQNGTLILALSSWHIYPDLVVLESRPVHVEQNDSLIRSGGVVTIAIQSDPTLEELPEGPHWSLPLNHIRHYGDTIVRTKTTGITEERVTFDEFNIVAVGSLLPTIWGRTQNFEPAVKFLYSLAAKSRDTLGLE